MSLVALVIFFGYYLVICKVFCTFAAAKLEKKYETTKFSIYRVIQNYAILKLYNHLIFNSLQYGKNNRKKIFIPGVLLTEG